MPAQLWIPSVFAGLAIMFIGEFKMLAQDAANLRLIIQGAGIAGDPHFVAWLIKQMEDLKLARLAGESFSFVTGLNLACLDLKRKPPEDFDATPTDNPEDEDIDMDPDAAKPQAWWSVNGQRFHPGTRYFMGEPVGHEHCLSVLKYGYQRQRIAAAHYLCLLKLGTVMFNCAAPAWRQQRLMARMS